MAENNEPVVKPEFTSQLKKEDLEKMRMQPKKRQPAQRNIKSVVAIKRRSKIEEEESKSDIEEKPIPGSINETVGINFSSVNLIVNHKHKNSKETKD